MILIADDDKCPITVLRYRYRAGLNPISLSTEQDPHKLTLLSSNRQEAQM